MKNVTVLSVVVASLLLIGCGEEPKEVAKESAPVEKAVAQKVEAEKKAEIEKAPAPKVEEAKPAAPEAKEETVSGKVEKAADSVADAGKAAVAAVTEKTAEVASDAKKVAVDAVEATKDAASKALEKGAEVAKEAKDAVAQKVEDVKKAVTGDVESINVKACAACHGANFEKKAMGVSKIVKDMSKADIVTSLKGYKDGSYGGAMKALMKGQVASYDDAKIEAVAAQIGK